MTLPVIDISSASKPGPERQRIARAMDEACRDTGFFLISGHGVNPQIIQHCERQASAFFDRPVASKKRIARRGHPYGYHPFEAEALAQSSGSETPPDLKETFNVGPVSTPGEPAGDETVDLLKAKNLWPDEMPDFQPAVRSYYQSLARLSDHMMDLFALALDLAPGYFRGYFRSPLSALRLIRYPSIAAEPRKGQLRAGAHTDYGTLTLLAQQNNRSGLQVLSQGQWVDVPTLEDTFVVNIGDLMARWTNDRWVSTLHRVIVPDQTRDRPRHSMVFFHSPDWHAEIRCLESCQGDGARYEPVKAGPHLASKFQATVE